MPNSEENYLIETLFNQDDTILAQIYLEYGEQLKEHFLIEFPLFRLDPFPLEDIITDALLNLCKNPKKFDPQKSSLKTYLFRDVKGDIVNSISKRNSKKNSVYNNLVELDTISGNIQLENETEELDIDPAKLSERFASYFASIFSNELDQKLAWMIKVEKSRETKKYCKLLEIEGLNSDEKEVIVKKHKDRINMRLKRSGYDDFLKELRQNT